MCDLLWSDPHDNYDGVRGGTTTASLDAAPISCLSLHSPPLSLFSFLLWRVLRLSPRIFCLTLSPLFPPSAVPL